MPNCFHCVPLCKWRNGMFIGFYSYHCRMVVQIQPLSSIFFEHKTLFVFYLRYVWGEKGGRWGWTLLNKKQFLTLFFRHKQKQR